MVIATCTKARMCCFGDIVDGKMILSETGEIAQSMWYEIPKNSSAAQLGAFVVMPDHVHGILIINNPKYIIEWGIEKDDHNDNNNREKNVNGQNVNGKNRFQNISENTVSSIIGSYKSAITKHANRKGLENGWQPQFYERIIKNHSAYHRITKYINDNPKKWKG